VAYDASSATIAQRGATHSALRGELACFGSR
jgi:hypothetical protein